MEELFKNITALAEDQREELFRLIKEQGINIFDFPIAIDDSDVYPLSFAQERLWFLHQMFGGDASDNVPMAFLIKGKLDIKLLESSFNAVISRHDILRCRIIEQENKLIQNLEGQVELSIAVIDLVNKEISDSDLQQMVSQEAIRSFSFDQLPLMKVVVFRIGPEKQILLINMHHIVSDGASLQLLYQEISQFYEAGINQEAAPELEELNIQYTDYATWQRIVVNEQVLESEYDFWLDHLEGTPEILELPKDYPRPNMQSFKGAKRKVNITGDTYSNLTKLSKEGECTLFMTLTAIYQLLIHRYSGLDDVVIASPISGRYKPELEPLIGIFLNMLVLRNNLAGNPSFIELLDQVKSNTLKAYQNQNTPFEKLVEKLRPTRDMSYHPLFQVVLQVSPKHRFEIKGLEIEQFFFDSGTAQYDLALHLFEDQQGLNGYFEYSTDLFKESTIDRMGRHLLTAVNAIAKDPTARIDQINILTEEELKLFQSKCQTPSMGQVISKTLIDKFEEVVSKFENHTAVCYQDSQLTYLELNHKANKWANYLLKKGVKSGDLVGICMERSLDLIPGVLGILKTGAAYLPIDLSYPAERLSFMVEDAGASIILTQPHLVDRIPPSGAQALTLEDIPHNTQETNPGLPLEALNLAYVIYTSGSTGKPKGVKITHYNVLRLFESTDHWFSFDHKDVWTLFHSYAFDFSVWEIWGALLYGGKLVVVPQLITRAPDKFYDLLETERVTILNQTPSAFYQLIKAEESKSSHQNLALRKVIFGGEALEIKQLRPWFERHDDQTPQLINMYGITETTVHVTYRPISKKDLESGSVIGKPIPDLKIYILDQNLQPVPLGVPGEMFVAGAGLAKGYLGRPELNASRFIENPHNPRELLYRTGDLARFIEDDDIEYLGRIDHQVKIRGFRIELGEIESILLEQPGVREAVVLVREDHPGDKRLVAYLLTTGDHDIDRENLRKGLLKKLPEYMVPASYMVMEEFPLTANGKLNRKALPTPSMERTENQDFHAPENYAEEIIASVWQNYLKVSSVDVNDNFFDIGGHSLLMLNIFNELNEKFDQDISIVDLYKYPTVHALAEYLSEGHSSKPPPSESLTDRAKRQKERREKLRMNKRPNR